MKIMAEKIVKTIITDRPPKQPKNSLEQLPEVKVTSRPPKIIKASEEKNKRPRAGTMQGGINFKGKPKIEGNGSKIK